MQQQQPQASAELGALKMALLWKVMEFGLELSASGRISITGVSFVTIKSADGEKTVILNQKVAPPLQHSFYTVGVHTFKKGTPGQGRKRKPGKRNRW